MAKKKTIDSGKLVREMARERIGIVPAGKVVPDKKKRKRGIKHKKREMQEAQE